MKKDIMVKNAKNLSESCKANETKRRHYLQAVGSRGRGFSVHQRYELQRLRKERRQPTTAGRNTNPRI